MGVDGTFGFFNDLAINTYWARTETTGVSGDDTSYRAQLDYNADRYGAQLEHLVVGDHFNPEVGFLRRDDIRRSSAQVRFSPRPSSMPSVRRFSWTGSFAYIENGAGRVDSARAGRRVRRRVSERRPVQRRVYGHVRIPAAAVRDRGRRHAAGRWLRRSITSASAGTSGSSASCRPICWRSSGTFYSGTRTALSASRGRMNLGPQLSLEPTYTVNWVDLAEGSFTTHLAGSRVTYTMTPRMFVSSLFQYTSSTNALTTNLRLRWEYQPGSELFVVYNDERDTGARTVPLLSTRSLIVKINRLFRL